MGIFESTPPPPRPSPTYDTPWREMDFREDHRDEMVNYLRTFELNDHDVPLRILLHGPVFAGKSSFISSLNSIFQGRVSHSAMAASSANKSFTKTYQSHYIRNGSEHLPFVFMDVMGLQKTDGGIHVDDIISALKGQIPEDYKFNPLARLMENDTNVTRSNKEPTLKDRTHCLVSVVDGNQIGTMSDDVINQMKRVREVASELKIPQVVIMTKPDQICELVLKDVKNIYKSKIIKQNMEKCSNRLGVPMTCILPVKNYHEETGLKNDVDVLLLTAMTQIVNFANDYIWNDNRKSQAD